MESQARLRAFLLACLYYLFVFFVSYELNLKTTTARKPKLVSVSSILYQRGIYPSEHFDRKKKYGLTMLVTSQPGLSQYLDKILVQLSGAPPRRAAASPRPCSDVVRQRGMRRAAPAAEWLEEGNLQRLVLVIASVATKEVLERWARCSRLRRLSFICVGSPRDGAPIPPLHYGPPSALFSRSARLRRSTWRGNRSSRETQASQPPPSQRKTSREKSRQSSGRQVRPPVCAVHSLSRR